MRRGWRTINATSANPPMHELSWSFLLFFCQKLTQDSNNNIRFSPPCDVLAHIRPWKIKLEPSAPSQTHLNWKKGREKLEATRPKNKRNYLIFSHFPPRFVASGSTARWPDRTRGHHEARVTFREVIWTFQPQTQNDVADTKRNSFSKASLLLFVPMLCLLDTVYSLCWMRWIRVGGQHADLSENKIIKENFFFQQLLQKVSIT